MSPTLAGAAEASLKSQVEQVLTREVPWETYCTARLLSEEDIANLKGFDKAPAEVQANLLLGSTGAAHAQTFLSVLKNITKEDTVQYTLALIHKLLEANEEHAALFHTAGDADPYSALLKLLQNQDALTQELACRTLVRLLVARPDKAAVERVAAVAAVGESSSHATAPAAVLELPPGPTADVLGAFIAWLCQQLKATPPGAASRMPRLVVWALAKLLAERTLRHVFMRAGGPPTLVPLLALSASSPANIQLVYETTLCVWLLSFVPAAAEALVAAKVLPALLDLAKAISKEKVIRMVVMSLKNILLIEGCPYGSEMADLNVLKVVALLQQGNWADEELVAALATLEADLVASVRESSTFEKYRKEVLSGTLDWSPIHTDAGFWRENITKFDQQNHQVLRVLLKLMEVSREPRTLAVACHDLSQFVQRHPHGKHVVQELGGKELAMGLLAHTDPEVQKQALLCVQKLMISNWQFFQAA